MKKRRKSPLEPEPIEPQMCSVDLRLEILRGVPFLAGLDDRQVAGVNRLFVERGYTPGETIYFAGDPAERLCVVASGKVKLMRHTFTGQDVLIDVLAPGELFGSLKSLGDETYPETAQAQTAACVLSVDAAAFRHILEQHPSAALRVMDIMAERLKAAHETVRQLSAHPVEKRIAHTLLKLGEKLGEPGEEGLLIQSPLTRAELAEMTGTTTETASRVMSQFQRDELIRSGRGWVAITDSRRLAAIAGDEPD